MNSLMEQSLVERDKRAVIDAEDAKNQRYANSMVIGKQTIEAKLHDLGMQEDVSDFWSDSDASDYRRE